MGRAIADPLAELYELIICTGMRKGEALALHWADVGLDDRLLFVRYTLSNINNTTLVFTTPKTKSSHTWIGSPRAASAPCAGKPNDSISCAWRPARSTRIRTWCSPWRTGRALRHEYVLHHLCQLTADAGLPQIRVHDLRHFAATTMLSSQVPLAMASKTHIDGNGSMHVPVDLGRGRPP